MIGIIDVNNGKYQIINNNCIYKVYIINTIDWCIKNISDEKFNDNSNNLMNKLYNCHKILFQNNEIWYPTVIPQCEIINQEFTIQHFIYFIIVEVVKVHKRRSKMFTKHDILEMLVYNIYNSYYLHIVDIFSEIYNYINSSYSDETHFKLSLLKDILYDNISIKKYMFKINFMNFTKEDLIYILTICCDNKYEHQYNYKFKSVIDCIHNIINNGEFKMEYIEDILYLYNTASAKQRIKMYEEELIIQTWKPYRLFDWCLDNEEKDDFDYECL